MKKIHPEFFVGISNVHHLSLCALNLKTEELHNFNSDYGKLANFIAEHFDADPARIQPAITFVKYSEVMELDTLLALGLDKLTTGQKQMFYHSLASAIRSKQRDRQLFLHSAKPASMKYAHAA